MVIREEQFQVFKEAHRSNVEKALVEHCREYAPRLFGAAGENGIGQAVHVGLQRAQGYSFPDLPQVRFYIDLMLVLGSDFDTDPQFPWATETLKDRFSRPHVRGMILHRDLSLYLDRVMGPGKEHLKDALDRFAGLPSELPSPPRRDISSLRGWVRLLFPQKSDDVSDAHLGQIAEAATQQANEFGLPAGDAILACVMLVFGHGATHDPLYPWISSVLRDPQITSGEGRLQRLWAKLRIYGASAGKHLA